MGFYELTKEGRNKVVGSMKKEIEYDFSNNKYASFLKYALDEDIYIRKNAYLIVTRNYRDFNKNREIITKMIRELIHYKNELVRQTIIYVAGEIGKFNAKFALKFLKEGMRDDHHKVRNAVMSSLKRMGERNPKPTLKFAKKYLNHPDPKIRRQIVHGIELRGRTHPEDVLPLLKEVQSEENRKVRDTIIHVLGQISYKEGCLETVLSHLKDWSNEILIQDALKEIIQVHKNYKFSQHSDIEVHHLIKKEFNSYKLA